MEITKELREELRAEWVAALRSGKFRQGRLALLKDGEYCCLGVACELIHRRFPDRLAKRTRHDGLISFGNATGVLPPEAMSILGVRDCFGSIPYMDSLSGMNDLGKSFSQIANVIESRPAGLFVE